MGYIKRQGWHGAVRVLHIAIIAAPLTITLGCMSPAEEARAYHESGMQLLEQGDLVKARLEFKNALQMNSEMAAARYGLALVAEQEGDWQTMLSLLAKVIESDPMHVEARVKQGRLLLAAGDLHRAREASETAMHLNPEGSEELALKAAVLYKLGDAERAREFAKAALARNPESTDALVVLAADLMTKGRAAQALERLDSGLRLDERNLALALLKVNALERLGRIEEAENVFRQVVDTHPGNRSLHDLLADFYVRHGLEDKAHAAYRARIAEQGGDLRARLDYLRFVFSVKGVEVAVAAAKGQVEKDPENSELRFALAELLRVQRDHAAAAEVLTGILHKTGDSAEGLRAKGMLAASKIATGATEEAGRLVAKILSVDSRDEEALFLRAFLAISDGEPGRGIADLRSILRDAPDSARTHLLLARAHEAEGGLRVAEDHYIAAFRASGFAAPYGVHFAGFLLREGNTARAEMVLSDVLTTSPGNTAALAMRAQLRSGGADAQTEPRDLKGGTMSLNEHKNEHRGIPEVFPGRAFIVTRDRPHGTGDAALEVQRPDIVGPAREASGIAEAMPDLETGLATATEPSPRHQARPRTGDSLDSAAHLKAVIRENPSDPGGYRALARFYVHANRHADAERVIRDGLESIPLDMELRYMRAVLHEMEGKFDEAIAFYEELIRERPYSRILANNLASLLAEHRTDPASLERAYGLALPLEGSEIPQYQDTLGWIYHKRGEHRRAKELLEGAAERLPDASLVRYHLGMNYLALADKGAARRELEKALELAAAEQASYAGDAVRAALESL